MRYGFKLKLHREKNGLTQEEAAKEIGISRNSLSMYENSKQPIPLTIFIKLARLYKCDVFDIMGVHDIQQETPLSFDVKPYYLIKAHVRHVIANEIETDEKFGNRHSKEYYDTRFRAMIADFVNNPIYAANLEGLPQAAEQDTDMSWFEE